MFFQLADYRRLFILIFLFRRRQADKNRSDFDVFRRFIRSYIAFTTFPAANFMPKLRTLDPPETARATILPSKSASAAAVLVPPPSTPITKFPTLSLEL
jgi:hypothetical protein